MSFFRTGTSPYSSSRHRRQLDHRGCQSRHQHRHLHCCCSPLAGILVAGKVLADNRAAGTALVAGHIAAGRMAAAGDIPSAGQADNMVVGVLRRDHSVGMVIVKGLSRGMWPGEGWGRRMAVAAHSCWPLFRWLRRKRIRGIRVYRAAS